MKASRAPGPISYSNNNNNNKARPLVGKTNADSKSGNRKAQMTNQEGGKLIKYIELDDIPDLSDGWNGQIDALSSNPHRSALLTGPGSPRKNVTESKERNAAVSYHIQTVHYDYYHENDRGKNSLKQPHSADHPKHGGTGTINQRTTHGNATAPVQASRTTRDDDWEDSDGENFRELQLNDPISTKIYYPQDRDISKNAKIDDDDDDDDDDNDDDFECMPQYYSPSKKKATILVNGSKSPIKISLNEPVKKQTCHVSEAQSAVSIQQVNARNPPPLPCDLRRDGEANKKYSTDEEKLYFTKQPRAVDFKPYTLNQYKQIKHKEYVEISNMKPDLNTDELIAKRKNVDRIKEFSKQLRTFNQEMIMQQPKKPSSVEENDMVVAKGKQESNRQKALEFAKNIPKPKSTTRCSQMKNHPIHSGSMNSAGGDSNGLYIDDDAVEAARLQELEMKHQQNKAKMEAIKRSLAL